MSTPAIINIEGITYASVYKHWDGYPEATLGWLEAFNANFNNMRGNDPEYKFAQLLRSSVRDAEEFSLDNSKHTGWGVLPYDTDCEYVYTLHSDGTVSVNSYGDE